MEKLIKFAAFIPVEAAFFLLWRGYGNLILTEKFKNNTK